MKKYGMFAAVLISLFLLHVNANAMEKMTEKEEQSENKEMKEEAVDKEAVKKEITVYQCPMKCEKDIVYAEEGKCPKCGMDLKKIKVEKAYNCKSGCEKKGMLNLGKKLCAHCGKNFGEYYKELEKEIESEEGTEDQGHKGSDLPAGDSHAVESEKTDHPTAEHP